MAELKRSFKGKNNKLPPVILIGTQSDLREDAQTLVQLSKAKETPISESEAKKLVSSMGFECYVESSSLTQKNLKEVFDEAIMSGLKGRAKRERRLAKKKAKSRGKTTGCIGRSRRGEEDLSGQHSAPSRSTCSIL